MTDNSIEKNVTDYMAYGNESFPSNTKATENIVMVINNNQQNNVEANLLNLTQCLGEYLIHEDDTVRAKSTGLLSNVIEMCDQSDLNEKIVGVLVNFYSSRLSDPASVPNLMTGLIALTNKFENFNAACTSAVVDGLAKNVSVQAFPHITRNAAFKVLENLLDNHCEDVRALNDKYICVVIDSMSGEKDPRNLMTVYDIILKIVKSLDISNHVEELFDATFCYFPITFRPPPDNPYGITSKDLKSNLRNCLASTPLFSKLGLPLLIQKMSTTSGSAKKDALQTVAACAPVYGHSELLPVGHKLFDAVKVEIISGNPDPALRDTSLDVIHSLTKAMTSHAIDPVKNKDVIEILKPLVDDCLVLLDELEEDNVKPASLVLRAAASASPFAYSYIETRAIPMLLRQYRDHTETKDRYLILCTLVAIIQARKIVFGPATEIDSDVDVSHESVLVSYKDRLVEIFSTSIRSSNEHPEYRLMGILGLGLFNVLKNYMTRSERGISIQSLNHVLEYEEEEGLRMSVEMSLAEISAFDPDLITHLTVPTLMELLPETSSTKSNFSGVNIVPYKLTLKTVQKLCSPHTIYQATEKELLRKFFLTCERNEDKKYAAEIISTLLHIIQTKDAANHSDLKGCAETLLPQLISSIIAAYLQSRSSGESKSIICSDEVMYTTYLIFQISMKNMSSVEQQLYVADTFRIFKEKDIATLKITSKLDPGPPSSNATQALAACTQIFSTIVCSIRKDVELPVDTIEEFLDDVIGRALKASSQAQVTGLARVVASVINKWKDVNACNAYLQILLSRLEDLVQVKSLSALTLYIWIAKALVTRSDKQGILMVDKIIAWIPDPVIGKQSSCGFDILLGDDPLCLNKQCFATVSLLHKQKFMAAVLPKLLKEFHTANDEDSKLNYLIAIAYLLKNVPKPILIDELPPLVPLLIESLPFADTVLKLSTLDLFRFALCEATHVMASNITTLLPAFTSLIGPNENSMKVRIAALKNIDLVCVKIPRDIVLPFVKDTLKSIAIPLDDKKRLVRKQAVECRESWYLISQKK